MISSHDTDFSTKTSQLRRAVSQPSLTRVYRIPTLVPPNSASSSTHLSPIQGASQPHSTTELAGREKETLDDEITPLKAWLRIAEDALRDAEVFFEDGDLDSAFVQYAIVAAIVLEKIPAHPDYRVLLSTTERHSMSLVSYSYSLGPRDCFGWSCVCPV